MTPKRSAEERLQELNRQMKNLKAKEKRLLAQRAEENRKLNFKRKMLVAEVFDRYLGRKISPDEARTIIAYLVKQEEDGAVFEWRELFLAPEEDQTKPT